MALRPLVRCLVVPVLGLSLSGIAAQPDPVKPTPKKKPKKKARRKARP